MGAVFSKRQNCQRGFCSQWKIEGFFPNDLSTKRFFSLSQFNYTGTCLMITFELIILTILSLSFDYISATYFNSISFNVITVVTLRIIQVATYLSAAKKV